jgi:hypothetical protein
MEFKSRIATMTPGEYAHFYESINTISRNRESDLNTRCLKAVLDALLGGQIRILDARAAPDFLCEQSARRSAHCCSMRRRCRPKLPPIFRTPQMVAAATTAPAAKSTK